MAGYADFKNRVSEANEFDFRLKPLILKVVDVAYGGMQGFNQAISLCQECFDSVRLVQEQNRLKKFFEEITFDTGMICYGVDQTMKNLKDGAVKCLFVYDHLDYELVKLKNKKTGEESVAYIRIKDIEYKSSWIDKEGTDFLVLDHDSLLDWVSEHYVEYKVEFYLITDKSPEGN